MWKVEKRIVVHCFPVHVNAKKKEEKDDGNGVASTLERMLHSFLPF